MWRTHSFRSERGYVVAQRDGSLTLLPTWMADPDAAGMAIVAQPRIDAQALIELRRIIDAAVSSQASPAGGARDDQ